MIAPPSPPLRLDELVARSLAGDGDAVAMIWEGQSFSWGWTDRLARLIDQTLASCQVPAGACVALVTRQQPDCCAAFMGLLRARYTVVMVYSYQSTEAMAADVRRLQASTVIASHADWTEALTTACAQSGSAGVSISPEGEVAPVAGLEACGPGPHRVPPLEPSVELLTSGTSGPPKRYPVSFEVLRKCVLGPANQASSTASGPGPSQISVPISNISGIFGFLMAVAQRRPMELHRKFSLDRWIDYVRTYRPRQAGLMPAAFKMILDRDVPTADLSSLEFVTQGMGPVDPAVRDMFETKYGIPILSRYGATEFVGAAASMSLEDYRKFGRSKYGSVGRAVRNVELRVVDPDAGEVISPGERVGLLEVLHHDIGEAWIRTSDLAHLDEDGFLFLHGRADGVINRGGFKVHPSAVEGRLLQHPSVAAASVVGIPHHTLGEVPVAALEAKPGADRPDEEEMKAYLRETLTAPSIPIEIRWVDELPRTQSHKIRLDGVRDLFVQEPA